MDTTRRAMLVAGTAALAAFKGVAAMTQTGRQDRLPLLDGELRFDEVSRAAAADDFGHLVHRTPAAVLLPASDRGRGDHDPVGRRARSHDRTAGTEPLGVWPLAGARMAS